jgi:hypothetical protein
MNKGGNKMIQKCNLCGNAEARIIERPRGYDGNHVICPLCSQCGIDRNAIKKIMRGHKVPDSLSSEVKSHFERTGEPYKGV